MLTPRLFLLLCVLVAAAPACAAPLQNGGVQVLRGADARLDLMCRYRAGDAAKVCGAFEDE